MGAPELIAALRRLGWTVAAAESLTGGLVTAELTGVPGASAVVRGGVVSYATQVKRSVLGVDGFLLDSGGAVQAQVAREMASGVRCVVGADLGLATTGVAGPDPQDGQPVGRVFVAAAWQDAEGTVRDDVRMADLTGARAQIRAQTVRLVLDLALEVLGGREDRQAPGCC